MRDDALFDALIERGGATNSRRCARRCAPAWITATCTWSAHLRLGSVLRTLGIVDMDPDAMLQQGVTSMFFPHGLGHPIGLQVHDVAGFSDEDGQLIPRPAGHPYLRMTRTLAPGMVVTIEPGIYFIPTLLAKLQGRRPQGEGGELATRSSTCRSSAACASKTKCIAPTPRPRTSAATPSPSLA